MTETALPSARNQELSARRQAVGQQRCRRCPVTATSDRSSGEPRLAFGVQEVADALGVSRELVKDMIRTGELPSVKLGRRRLISRKALERFLAGRRYRMRNDTKSQAHRMPDSTRPDGARKPIRPRPRRRRGVRGAPA